MGTQIKSLSRMAKQSAAVDFEAAYREELPRIYNFLSYRLGDDQLAEDLTTETFEMYILSSPGVAAEDLIRMAESIP